MPTYRTRESARSVVVPAIDVPSSVACLRSLGRRGVRTIAVSDREMTPAFRSAYCDETATVPSPHQDLVAYKDALLSLAKRSDVGTVVPVREEDVYVLAKYRDEFEPHVGTPWPSIDTLGAVQDRIRLFTIAGEAGVSAPETRLLDATAEWDRKWIVKSRYSILADEYVDGYPPQACVDPPTTKYLRPGTKPDIDGITAEMGHVPLLQEYVTTTDEYGFFAIYDRGEALATFQHRQNRGYSYAGGASAFRESIFDPELEKAGRTLLDSLEWHGVAMVEFLRETDSGAYKLMEVNPRFWSSLPFSVRAGADFPYYYWALANDAPEEIEDGYETGVAGHFIRGELLHLHSILTEDNPLVARPSFTASLRDVLESTVRHPRFDYLRLDDPCPFVRDAINTAIAFRSHIGSEEATEERQITRSGSAWEEPTDERESDPGDVLDELDRDQVLGLETTGEANERDG